MKNAILQPLAVLDRMEILEGSIPDGIDHTMSFATFVIFTSFFEAILLARGEADDRNKIWTADTCKYRLDVSIKRRVQSVTLNPLARLMTDQSTVEAFPIETEIDCDRHKRTIARMKFFLLPQALSTEIKIPNVSRDPLLLCTAESLIGLRLIEPERVFLEALNQIRQSANRPSQTLSGNFSNN